MPGQLGAERLGRIGGGAHLVDGAERCGELPEPGACQAPSPGNSGGGDGMGT